MMNIIILFYHLWHIAVLVKALITALKDILYYAV